MFGFNDEARNIKGEFNQSIVTEHGGQKQSVVLDGDLPSFIHRQSGIAKQLGEGVIITAAYGLIGQAVRGFMYVVDLPSVGLLLTTATPITLIVSFLLSVVVIGSLLYCYASTHGDRFNATCRLCLMVLGFISGVV